MKILKWLVTLIFVASLTVQFDFGSNRLQLLAQAHAQAGGILPISWTPPTQYTDGFPLLEQELDFYTFYCGAIAIKQINVIIGTWADNVDISSMASGAYVCHLTTTSLEGIESGPSNTINFTIGARTPGNPAGLIIS